MKLTFFLVTCFIVMPLFVYGQTDSTIWKELKLKNNAMILYDSSMLDSAQGTKFDIWVLQKFNPPLEFEDINGKVYKSKTLYSIDSNKLKYGISEVIYFDRNNKEIFKHIYNKPDSEENIKYNYPVSDYSFIYELIKIYTEYKGE